MDEREILTRFKTGTLGRAEATRLLAGRTDTAGPAPGPEAEAVSPTAPPQAGGDPATTGRYAVVGLAGRYPMAGDLHAYWENLRTDRDTSRGAPASRPGAPVLGPGQRGHFLDDVAEFDCAFFGLTSHEGALMDPQERLFLETAWEALEDAGLTGARLDALTGPGEVPRAVGVFVGISSADYALLAAESWGRQQREMPSSGHGHLPGRLAALLGLSGPGQAVDTGACSALTAVHLAVESLARGECTAAVAGGVELLLHASRAGDGIGEGVGAVVLKQLERALLDGDRVHAVIRGTASGFRRRSPTPAAAGAAEVTATGTGPIQTRDAIVRRVGEAGAALGVAGITAAVLQAEQAVIAPAREGEESVPWQRRRDEQGQELPRGATVEVAGEHGLVARAVVEEFLPLTGAGQADGGGCHELVLLSAPTPDHLAATAAKLADWLQEDRTGDAVLADVARHLRAGRAALPCRLALLVADVPELVAGLRRFAQTRTGGEDLRHADLRDGRADPLGLGEAPETRDYLAALWRSGRLEQLTRLWLSGVEVDWAALESRPATTQAVPPPSAFLRRTLWLDPVGERAG